MVQQLTTSSSLCILRFIHAEIFCVSVEVEVFSRICCFIFKTISKVSNENVNKRLKAQSKAANETFFLRSLVFAFFRSPFVTISSKVFRRFENVYIFEGYRKRQGNLLHMHRTSCVCIYICAHNQKLKLRRNSEDQKYSCLCFPHERVVSSEHKVTNYHN